MNKQQARLQRRTAKRLARVLFQQRKYKIQNGIFIETDGVSAVQVTLLWNGREYYANAGSKCNRTDEWNLNLGIRIAVGRALIRIAFKILKDEDHSIQPSIDREVFEVLDEYGVKGVIFVKSGPDPRVMLETPEPVPGSAKYRGSEEQYGYGVTMPEVVKTGLEVIKEKEHGKENEQSASGPGASEGQ